MWSGGLLDLLPMLFANLNFYIMMKRAFIELFALVALFFGTWFAASQVNWIDVLRVKKVSKTTEEKWGELLRKIMIETESEIKQATIYKPVDSLLNHLCKTNDIDRKLIKLYVIDNSEINAFAMPGGHIVVYSGLLQACNSEAQLAGVMAHELAHIQLRHVMKKLIKEVGLSALLGATTGSGGEVIKESLKHLSSTAYDRELEQEADLKAVSYLENAAISATPFAEFMYQLAAGSNTPYLVWISTHPDSEERAAYISEQADQSLVNEPVLDKATWQSLKNAVEKNAF